jgi:hypothetical protein
MERFYSEGIKGLTCFKGEADTYEDMWQQLKDNNLKFHMKAVVLIDSKLDKIGFVGKREGYSNTLGINLYGGRATGKTVRQIDEAIRLLFSEGGVEIRDHEELGGRRIDNELLFRKVLKRLHSEHEYVYEHELEKDIKKLIIKLKSR